MASSTVEIRAIASGGDGVSSLPDGRTVFVPRTAPGDRVTLRNIRMKARMARAEVASLESPGPGRVDPPCEHYVRDRCGGCQLMHLDMATQHGVKARIAGDAMRRIAKLDVDDPPLTPAPESFGYRARVTLAVRGGSIGYHRVGRPDEIFDVRRCLVAEPTVQSLIDGMRSARRHLPTDATRVVLRRDRENQLHVVVRSDGGGAWSGGPRLHADLHRQGIEATVWWHPEGGGPRAVAGSADPWPATVFVQVHPAMGELVRAEAIAALGALDAQRVWDLYAGIGETTAALAAAGAHVESVERDQRAVAAAERAGPSGPIRRSGSAEDVVSQLKPADRVVTNPPRTGMDAAVTSAIATSGATRVAYISCDPATLARDIRRLDATYRLQSLAAYDQFPQTSHLECLAVLEQR